MTDDDCVDGIENVISAESVEGREEAEHTCILNLYVP